MRNGFGDDMRTHITNGNGSATAAPRVLDGRGIANRHPDKRRRAVLAAELADGRAIIQLSLVQLTELLGVSRDYIRAARRLTPEKRRAILSGRDATSFAAFCGPTSPRPALAPVNDAALIELARSVGPDRLFAAIERVL
jgi:hypothetical protein